MTKKYSKSQWVIIVVAFVLFIVPRFFHFLPSEVVEGEAILTQSGLTVLLTTVAAILLFVFVSTDWPSLALIVAIAALPEMGMAKTVQNCTGNATAWYLLLCFMLAASLVKTGIAHRIAVMIMAGRFSRKGPWFTIAMIFAANFLVSSVLSSTATIMIMLPIAYEIFAEMKIKKNSGNRFAMTIVMSLVVVGQLAQATSPISHVHTALGVSTYATYMNEDMGLFQYMGVALPTGIIAAVVWFLICKFIIRPDVSGLKEFNHDTLLAELPPFSKREKAAGIVYGLCIVFWLLPGLSQYLIPSIYPTLKLIQQCFPPMVALIVLHLWRVDGEPVLPIQEAFKAAPVGTYLFIAALMLLSSCFTNADLGLSPWLASVLGKAVGNVSPMVFLIIIYVICLLATNFIANALAISTCLSIGMPLCLSLFAGRISPMLVCIMVTIAANIAYATPCATPPCAVAQESGYLTSKELFLYGTIGAVITGLVAFLVAVPLSGILGI